MSAALDAEGWQGRGAVFVDAGAVAVTAGVFRGDARGEAEADFGVISRADGGEGRQYQGDGEGFVHGMLLD